MRVICYGDKLLDIAKILLQHPDISLDDVEFNSGDTLLHRAIAYNGQHCARLLAQHPKMAINKQNSQGRTALHEAIMRQQMSVIEALLNRADIQIETKDCDDRTPLRIAIDSSYVEGVELLLSKGSHVSIEDIISAVNSEIRALLNDAYAEQIIEQAKSSGNGVSVISEDGAVVFSGDNNGIVAGGDVFVTVRGNNNITAGGNITVTTDGVSDSVHNVNTTIKGTSVISTKRTRTTVTINGKTTVYDEDGNIVSDGSTRS